MKNEIICPTPLDMSSAGVKKKNMGSYILLELTNADFHTDKNLLFHFGPPMRGTH